MAELFPYGKRTYYPHMKPNDTAIWERFMSANQAFFDTVQYDVLVGTAPDFDTVVNTETGGSIEALYKKKIDVVGHKDGKIFIVEVKPRAGASAIGQLLGYVELYKRDVKPSVEPQAILLTDTINKDTQMVAEKFKVQLIAV